jgi:hypothetical protein
VPPPICEQPISPSLRHPVPVTRTGRLPSTRGRRLSVHRPVFSRICNATAQDTAKSWLSQSPSQQAKDTPVFWPGTASAVLGYITVYTRGSLGGMTTARSIMWAARAAKSEKAPKGTLGVLTLYHMPPSAHAPLCVPGQGFSGWTGRLTPASAGRTVPTPTRVAYPSPRRPIPANPVGVSLQEFPIFSLD